MLYVCRGKTKGLFSLCSHTTSVNTASFCDPKRYEHFTPPASKGFCSCGHQPGPLIHLWHCLPEDGMGSHRLGVQSPRLTPPQIPAVSPTSFLTCASDCPVKNRGSHYILFGFCQCAWETTKLRLTHLWLIVKDIAKDTDKEMHRARYRRRDMELPCPLGYVAFYMFSSPQVLQTLSFWLFMETSLHRLHGGMDNHVELWLDRKGMISCW